MASLRAAATGLCTSQTIRGSARAASTRGVAPVSSPCSARIVLNPAAARPAAARRLRLSTRAEATGGSTAVATPVVKIDNFRDPFATIVTVEYGDHVGELLETITALKNLNLNIRRAKVTVHNSSSLGVNTNTFYITESDTSEKIVKSARLEEIRLTVLSSLVATFPESAVMMGGSKPTDSELTPPLGRRRAVVQTLIGVEEAPNGAASLLRITTADRPGLLVDIVRVLKDINLNVVSAEVDTVGAEARDEFFVTYHGEPLTTPMITLVTNALQYYLSLSEVAKEESY
eukprot:CAMPEP_0119108872 /NCGR_PEP_ID=MMETSP1180-20130426/15916_1 /TAXON_ID=3052 ORGANISM="Chlamydomonas cf sp, Strain CCMP681" /NCGR_SAMPLE_ID=MMETSP1180 /ASSEMBLY_ACC=CAM_ASM_000741 /LENGTH=287 /DNA_ID=CAMNT_0007094545 /DNA_START=53 /DNA_END=916 /DNA_ORIENTATION=+